MASKYIILLYVVVGAFVIDAEQVLFPYGETFSSVLLEDVPESDRNKYALPIDTGSLLYDTEAGTNTLTKKIGLNIQVQQFKSDTARYFRAHPVFIECAEQAIIKLLNEDISVEILRGHITSDESTGSDMDQYHQSGSAMELGIVDNTGNVEDIAGAVLKVCPVILERELRDLGMVIMPDRVHFRMSEADSAGPSYSANGYSGISDLNTWVQGKINQGLEPLAASNCENYQAMAAGDQRPSDKTQEQIVGTLDTKVSRDMTKDFKRLKQYQGSDIEFENTEGSAAWCGTADNQCPTVCADQIQGNSASKRCADRLMSPRLYGVVNKVAKKVKVVLGDKLKVTEAWDEAYAGHEEGDNNNDGDDPLHYEGRAAKLELVSGSDDKLGDVAKYAACFGADYIEHRVTYIYISVKRAKLGGSRTTFPNIDLLHVDPPEAVESLYSLPGVYSASEAANYPLFDGAGKENTELASGVTIKQFMSKNARYFRLDPKLVECYRDVLYGENQRKAADAPDVEITVLTGYLTNSENGKKFDAFKDKRYNRHTMGNSLQLTYAPSTQSDEYTPFRLLYKVIDKCAWRFHKQSKMEMGVGLYANSVFMDIRPAFTVMAESLNHLPEGIDADTFEQALEERFDLAKDKRVVDPDDYATACLFQTSPKPQSSAFVHEHSEAVKRKRRRKRSTDDERCTPRSDTEFCQITESHRVKVVEKITTHLNRKHYSERPKSEIMAALNGCFLTCGTCLEGSIWDEKTEHCNNFIHWVNWTLLNDQEDVSNSFVSLDRHACEGGNDCVQNAPLFSLIAPGYYRIFRPDPAGSVEEFVYSSANNPSPVMSLVEDMYGIQASGVVKFWVKDDTEMTALKRQLEVVMMYNKRVTRIDIYIDRFTLTKDAVTAIVEKAARTMVTQGCPEVTRETLTPYTINPIPAERKKRVAEAPSLRHQVRKEKLDIDANWLKKNRYF